LWALLLIASLLSETGSKVTAENEDVCGGAERFEGRGEGMK
jgi:hypothetical protein